MKPNFVATLLGAGAMALLVGAGTAIAAGYAAPAPLNAAAQAPVSGFKGSKGATIAYMPPATEFNYYIAIGKGIEAEAAKKGIKTFMLAPQSGADINGQMGMIQDVINRGVNAIIFHTHDEHAAAPLIKR
jgi:ribose transport system substrate-binding protein